MKRAIVSLGVAALLATIAPEPAAAADDTVRWKLASAYPGRMVQLGLLGKNLPKKQIFQ